MSTVQQAPSRNSVLLHNVEWETYTRLLRTFEGRSSVRLTYDRGALEIMSPSTPHGLDESFLARLVVPLCEEIGQPVIAGGSITFRRRRLHRGLEPDGCFWIANEPRMRGKRRVDLRVDPPPDLAIEVEVTRSALDRMGIYAKLGVPEVWRLHDEAALTFHGLDANGKYVERPLSVAFPFVTPAHVLKFLTMRGPSIDDNSVVQQFREWVQRASAGGP